MISIQSLLNGNVRQAIRIPEKPIIVPRQEEKYWWERKGVFNPGVAEYGDSIVLLYRAYDDFRISRLGYAESKDGIHFMKRDIPAIDTKPSDEFERLGIEDPRITCIDGTYYIVHTVASYYPIGHSPDVSGVKEYIPWRVRVGMHSTSNFKRFKHWGVILPDVPVKNGCLLPEKINGNFGLYYRQHSDNTEILKLVFTPDFKQWSEPVVVPWPTPQQWQQFKFGVGSQPLAVQEGFLMVYHAVDQHQIYRLGLMLFDRTDPTKILWHSDAILEPVLAYETAGFVPNVVYTCGALIKGTELWIYYGAADAVIGRAVISLT